MNNKMKKKKSQRRTTRSLRDKVLAFTLALCMLVPNASMVANAKDTSSGTKDTYVEASASPAAIGELETNTAEPATTPAGEAEESIESGQQPESTTEPDISTPAPDAATPAPDAAAPAPDAATPAPDAAAPEPNASGESADLPSPAGAPAQSRSNPSTPADVVPEETAEATQTPQPFNTKATELYQYEYSVNGGPVQTVTDIRKALEFMKESTDYTKSYIKIVSEHGGFHSSVITTDYPFTLDLNDKEMTIKELNINSSTVRVTGGPNGQGNLNLFREQIADPAMIRVTGTGHLVLDGATIDCFDYYKEYGSNGVVCEGSDAVAEVNGTINAAVGGYGLMAVNGSTLKVTGGTYDSTIYLMSEKYAGMSKVYLSGNIVFNGILMYRLGKIYANDGGATPNYFLPKKPCTIMVDFKQEDRVEPGLIFVEGVENANVFSTAVRELTPGYEAKAPDSYPGNITLQKKQKLLDSLSFEADKYPVFYAGERFDPTKDPTKIKVYANYADDTRRELALGEYTIIGADEPFRDEPYKHYIHLDYTEGDITKRKTIYSTVKVRRTITYDTDGGTPIPDPTTMWSDEYHSEPTPAPTKPGYTFKYWSRIKSNKEVEFNFKQNLTSENITLKAKWEALPVSKISITSPPAKTVYKVGETFDTTGMVVKTVFSDGSEVEVTDYTTSIGDNKLTADDTTITITYESFTATQDITVNLPFNVTFDVDGGKETYDTQKVFNGENATKPTTDPTKTGYTFKYWYKEGENTEFDFTSTPITADTVLKAKWVDETAPKTPDIKYLILSGPGAWEWNSFNEVTLFTIHFNKDISIKFSSDDKGSKVKSFTYTLPDGTEKTINATDGQATITIQGPYTGCISNVFAEDNAGNKSPVSSTPYFGIDKEDPSGTITVETDSYTPGQWSDVPVSLTVSGASAASGINRYEYSTDNGVNWYGTMAIDTTHATSSTPMVVNKAMITFNKSDDFTIIFRAVSNASNISDNSTGTTVKIDTVAPKFTLSGNTTDYVVKDTITLKDVIAYSGVTKVEVKKDEEAYTEITDTYADGYEVTEKADWNRCYQ